MTLEQFEGAHILLEVAAHRARYADPDVHIQLYCLREGQLIEDERFESQFDCGVDGADRDEHALELEHNLPYLRTLQRLITPKNLVVSRQAYDEEDPEGEDIYSPLPEPATQYLERHGVTIEQVDPSGLEKLI